MMVDLKRIGAMMVDLKRIGGCTKAMCSSETYNRFGGFKYNLLTNVVNGFSDCETSTGEVIPLWSH